MEEALERLAIGGDTAGKWLEEFFKNPKPSEKDLKKARIVTSHRATQVRAFAAITAKDRVRFSLARLIIEDKDQLAAYLNVSLPKP